MPIYELNDGRRIVADAAFIAAHHPDAVLIEEPPAPIPAKWITLVEARELFTDSEKINIYTAAKTEVAVQVWLDDLHAVQNQMVNKSDPRFIAGVSAMEYGNLIGAGRAAVILA